MSLRSSLRSPAAVRVLDLAAGVAGALAATLLADIGCRVVRVAPAGDEVFDELHPAHAGWRSGAATAGPGELDALLAAADVVLVGGEDHPEVAVRRDATALARAHPRLVVVDLAASVPGAVPQVPAVDLLVQARTGLVAEHLSARPICFAVPFPTYGQALLAVLGTWAGLLERLDSGRGQVVTASLQQGAALFMMPFWMRAERADAAFGTVAPKDVEHLLFRCADGGWVQFVMGVPAAVAKLYRVLGIDAAADPADRGIPKPGTPVATYFGDRPLIARHVARMARADVLAAAAALDLPAAPVLAPGEFFDDEQVRANDLLADRGGATGAGCPIGVSATAEAGPPPAPVPDRALPLAGVRVLDVGTYVAGPLAARLLGDLGADVVKIEDLRGDPNRGMRRHLFATTVGKRAVALDLKSADGRDVLDRLLRGADVVMHNLRPGVPGRLGLPTPQRRGDRPELVTVASLAFGPDGPRATDPGFDMILQALLGLSRRAGGAAEDGAGPPVWYRTPYLDYATGALGAIAVLVALHERRVSGRAADLWVSLLGSGLFLLSDLQRTAAGRWLADPPLDADRVGSSAVERLYRTGDGWVAVAARGAGAADALWAVAHPGGPPAPARPWDADAAAALAAAFAARPTDALLADLAAADVWAQRCRTDGWAELAADPATRAAGLLVDRVDEHYGAVTGCLGPLVTFSRTDPAADGRPGVPAPGRDTRSVLAGVGYDDEQIAAMAAAGTIGVGREMGAR